MRHLLTTATVAALLVAFGGATTAQEASPEPGASPTPEQLAEAEERLATATCLGKPATIVAIAGFETVGTPGADVIVGTRGDDSIRGEGGNDRICAGPGADLVEGGAGKDRIDGGLGNDELDGGAGNDTINGGKGADKATGAAGNDRLTGAGGDDTLDGGGGNDVCDGGPGHDWLPGCNDKRGTKGKLVIRRNTTLKGPHRGPIVIEANKVTLDCGGHTVRGNGGGIGIWLNWRLTGITVKNCEVTNFHEGILVDQSRRNSVINNKAHHNSRTGIYLRSVSDSKVIGNIADDNGFGRSGTNGIEVAHPPSRNNIVRDNIARNNGDTNIFVDSSRSVVTDNTVAGGANGIGIGGDGLRLERNTISGSSNVGITSAASRSTVKDNIVTDTLQGPGVQLTGGRNRIVRNEIYGNGWVGFEDRAVPGSNIYADNICFNNQGGDSAPEGLCDDTLPAEPEPATEPSDSADAAGEPTAEG